jgi:hypothetical protein
MPLIAGSENLCGKISGTANTIVLILDLNMVYENATALHISDKVITLSGLKGNQPSLNENAGRR